MKRVSIMWFRAGLVAIVLSFVPWLAIALAPVLGLSIAEGAGLVGVAVVVAEVLFWAGLALTGKDTWRAVKAHGWAKAPRELVRLLMSGRSAPLGGEVVTELGPETVTSSPPTGAPQASDTRSA